MLCAQADRDGRAEEFAGKFRGSAVAYKNEREMARQIEQQGELSLVMQKELAAKRDTSTSFFWGWHTILRCLAHHVMCACVCMCVCVCVCVGACVGVCVCV